MNDAEIHARMTTPDPAPGINPRTGRRYMGHVTGDIRDLPEAQEAYALLARVLRERRSAG